jgi:hypothetical protein
MRRRSLLTTVCIGVLVLAFGFLAAAVTSESDGACKPKTETTPPPGDDDGGGNALVSPAAPSPASAPSAALKGCHNGDDDDDDDDADDTTTGGVVQAITPVYGQSVVVTVLSGTVLVKLPGSDVFTPLTGTEVLPVGTVVDARNGWIRLTSATGPTGALRSARGLLGDILPGGTRRVTVAGAQQTADFFGWSFAIGQPGGLEPVTEIRMTGGAFASCPSGSASASSVRMLTPRSRVRRVWGSGKGRFRTRGRYAAATARGTEWLTEDRCDGTLIAVRSGVVSVFDYVRKRTVLVSAGHVRLIRAPG